MFKYVFLFHIFFLVDLPRSKMLFQEINLGFFLIFEMEYPKESRKSKKPQPSKKTSCQVHSEIIIVVIVPDLNFKTFNWHHLIPCSIFGLFWFLYKVPFHLPILSPTRLPLLFDCYRLFPFVFSSFCFVSVFEAILSEIPLKKWKNRSSTFTN